GDVPRPGSNCAAYRIAHFGREQVDRQPGRPAGGLISGRVAVGSDRAGGRRPACSRRGVTHAVESGNGDGQLRPQVGGVAQTGGSTVGAPGADGSVGHGPVAGGNCTGGGHRSLLCEQSLAATWRSRASWSVWFASLMANNLPPSEVSD